MTREKIKRENQKRKPSPNLEAIPYSTPSCPSKSDPLDYFLISLLTLFLQKTCLHTLFSILIY